MILIIQIALGVVLGMVMLEMLRSFMANRAEQRRYDHALREHNYRQRLEERRGPGETVKMNCRMCGRAEMAVVRPDGTMFAWDEHRIPEVAPAAYTCWHCLSDR